MIRILGKLLRLPADLWQMLVTHLPGGVGLALRLRFWRRRLSHLGRDCRIEPGVHIENPGFVRIEDHAWIDRNVLILAGPPGGQRATKVRENPHFQLRHGEVRIGANTHIAPNCVLSGHGGIQIGANCGIASGSLVYSYSHHYRNLADPEDHGQYSFTPLARPDQQAMVLGPVVLEDYCAVGLGVVILPGTTARRGTWIASGCVVNGVFPDQTLARERREIETRCLTDLEIKT